MKILALLILAVAVSARPELDSQRLADSQEIKDSLSAQDSASLPSGVWLVRQRRELYGEGGAEIPVHLVYEEEAGSNRVSREPDDRRRCGSASRRQRRSRRAIGGHHSHNSQEPLQQGGPSIVKLKVRRGGVAIAGPGGVATAGSGGTAIVGPGGTAYTTPDGTAVVGPGGRLIELSPYVTKGRSRGVPPMLIYLPEYGIAGARRPTEHRTKLPYQRQPLQPQGINAQKLGLQQLSPQALGLQHLTPEALGMQQLSPQAMGIHRINQGFGSQQAQPALPPQGNMPLYSQALPLLLPLPVPHSIPYDLDISDWLSGLEESIRADEDSVLVAASDNRRTSLLLRPVAKAVAGPRGVAVASPVAKAIIRKGEPVTIDFDPDAVAIAGPGGSAEAHPKLVISYASENQDLASLISTPASDIPSSTPRPLDHPTPSATPLKKIENSNAPDKVISLSNYRQ